MVYKDLDSNMYKVWWEHRGEDIEENINSYNVFHTYLVLGTVYMLHNFFFLAF